MASPYYVDPAASGDNDGTTWANAWQTLQRAVDGTDGTQPIAGDTVYCRGTETLGVTCDFDGTEGTEADGFIKYVGCAADGTVDGTRYAMDGDSTAVNCILLAGKDYIWWENFEFYGATGAGWDRTSANWAGHVFINCISHDNGGDGFDLYYGSNTPINTFIRCQSYSNTSGWGASYRNAVFILCEAKDNSLDGFEGTMTSGPDIYIGCLAHNNGNGTNGHGFDSGTYAVYFNCVSDENDDNGIDLQGGVASVIGCRLTDNGKGDSSGYGLALPASKLAVYGWNFLLNNATAATSGAGLTPIPYNDDADTNETAGTEGYTDAAADDYNLTAAATLRSTAIEID